ncbi:hypothetical protein GGS20DRAFT_229281 [Poronia punctata]|nr:hypothetical protein GGS20DRAFT_229281 [Poronia punctata]
MQTMSNTTARHGRSGSGSSTATYPSPASPTLTNPDMILPDYDEGPVSPDRSHSPLMAWKNAHVADMGFDLSMSTFTTSSISTTTPIIYGNGTMLSDIGEVTEVESTCDRTRSRSNSNRSDFGMVPSTELQYEAIKQRIKQSRLAHQRQISVGSNSTVTGNDQSGLLGEFDDAVSIDDSNFQGDDEDSVADSYIDDEAVQQTVSKAQGHHPSNAEEARYSSPLSRRAEQILANAKRRLTTMEDNLNRARSSLDSPSLSSLGSYSTPSPQVGRPATAVSVRGDQDGRKVVNGHNRISSEGNVPTENKHTASTQRSSSALGTAGGYRRPSHAAGNGNAGPTSRSLYGTPHFASSKISLHAQERTLAPLGEDDVLKDQENADVDSDVSNGEVFLTPTLGTFSDQSLRRSTSSATMRDLKDQMNDLKGRLATLRDQARADTMKRRSLQSLRTPSPFTHARVEQWYAETNAHDDGITSLGGTNTAAAENKDNVENQTSDPLGREKQSPVGEQLATPPPEEEKASLPAPTAVDGISASPAGVVDQLPELEVQAQDGPKKELDGAVDDLDDIDDMRTEDGYELAEETNDIDDTASESGESSYHDSVQVQVSHEDREDAFDYEHFFLHSAMGSMSRRRLRRSGSSDSLTSDDSVETARGPTASYPPSVTTTKVGRHSRRGSADSISTLDSFATATEGRRTRTSYLYQDDNGDDYFAQVNGLPERARTHTPETAKRKIGGLENGDFYLHPSRSRTSLTRRPQSSAASFQHRSTASAGTNRSFPLVNKSRMSRGAPTPEGSNNYDLKRISDTLMNETASICDKESLYGGDGANSMRTLHRDDQILIERLVGSLGRCVLGLTEAGRASSEGRAFRRRIEAARRALEGLD